MSKIRVHELAKELNKSSKDVIYALKGHGAQHGLTITDAKAELLELVVRVTSRQATR